MLVNLQYLRAFAAIIVVLYHLLISSMFEDAWFAPFTGVVNFGSVGVDIFFCLSGFIIAYSVFHRSIKPSRVKFFLLRAARIYPVYWFFSFVILIVLLTPITKEHSFSVSYIIQSFLLLPAVNSEGDFYPLLFVGWSLIFEMYFYLIFVLFLPMDKWKALAFQVMFIIALAFLAPLFPAFEAGGYLMANKLVAEFLCGFFIYNLYSSTAVWNYIVRWRMLISAVSLVTGGLLLAFREDFEGGIFIVKLVFSLSLLLVALMYQGLFTGHVARALKHVGDASYSLYLSHAIVIMLLTGLWKRGFLFSEKGFEVLYVFLMVLFCTFISVCFYLLIEKRVNLFLSARIKMATNF